MKLRGWNKAEFARRCGIQPQHVNLYLSGKLNPENLLLPLHDAGEDIEWIKSGGEPEKKMLDKKRLEGVAIWESRSGHFTEQEKKDLDKFIAELLDEADEVNRKNAIEVARVVLGKKGTKKKE